MKLIISKRAAWIAGLAALPFISIGDYFFYCAFTSRWPLDWYVYGPYGHITFLLGSPLTLIYRLIMPFLGKVLVWAIGTELGVLVPAVYSILFVIQWILWSQLIVLIYRKFRKTLR